MNFSQLQIFPCRPLTNDLQFFFVKLKKVKKSRNQSNRFILRSNHLKLNCFKKRNLRLFLNGRADFDSESLISVDRSPIRLGSLNCGMYKRSKGISRRPGSRVGIFTYCVKSETRLDLFQPRLSHFLVVLHKNI